ncbi:putative dna replication licensing factor MCM4 [Schistosoma mansoni]|uniref:putative dna replication licensing factor MCM4 n=1 Tax=Schistosoma mansoni TaxID=6183 RepID=UPI00022DBFBA|nr:putative dna replication licensing factor MCM4 [Schistosoma mansoni]|eukprot:XP_018653176.1 putative dna replication licensing factor MCM4 [Schistosoma mansoni]
MSSLSSRSSRRRHATNDEQLSGDLLSAGTTFERTGESSRTRGRTRHNRSGHTEPTSNAEPTSGLRTSEVEPGSPLSYSDMSSVATGVEDVLSSVRPGVNDEVAVRAVLSQSGPLVPATGVPGTTDGSTASGPQARNIFTVIWGTDVNIAQVMSRFKHFLLTYIPPDLTGQPNLTTGQPIDPQRPLYLQRMEDLAISGSTALDIDCEHLRSARPDLYTQLVTFPKEVIPACDAATHALFLDRFREVQLERSIQIRPFNCARSRDLRSLDPDDLDQLVTVSGLVIRLSPLIPEMMRAEFKCAICGAMTSVPCERGRIAEPEACIRCHSAHTAQLQHNRCLFVDKQMIKLQESPENMPASQTPHTVLMYAHEELVDKIQPGDRVIVTGIYRAIPLRMSNRQRTLKAVYKTYIDVLHFLEEAHILRQFTEERIEEFHTLARKPDLYERLAAGIAPTIYENEDIKKGILLQLFGGTRKDFTAKGRGDFRSEINILLCGDPGTSKSQLLQYVYRLTPRGQYTSGKGSSAVGLTAYITKDAETRQLTLQTGALVLADNGICCIDEFDKMSDSTRSVLHEVMEQQTLSIAKAGILCQLHARTSILAAANPIGSKWDPSKTIIDNIQLPHTLLSRFDLIFLILDPQDEVYDTRLARHLVGLYYRGAVLLDMDSQTDDDPSFVNGKLLKDYIAYAKMKYFPKLTEEAGEYLVREYVEMRKLGSGRGQISAYPRQLESLVRLAEAHARLRLSNHVTADDCREARRLQREALKQAAIDPLTGTIDINILTTGISSSVRKRREEMAMAIWSLLEERPRVLTFVYSRVLEDLRARSERMITRENFEDGLNFLKNTNKIDWAGNTIRKR